MPKTRFPITTGEHEKEVQDQYHVLVTHALPGSEILADAIDMIRAVRTGSEEQTILLFNSQCKELKEAVKRAAELTRHLTAPARADLKRAGTVITNMWPFLAKEPDLEPSFNEKAEKLTDLLARETFFHELPAIDQLSRDLEKEYQGRFHEAATSRKNCYADALEKLEKTPGYEKLSQEQQKVIRDPLEPYVTMDPDLSMGISQLRADIDAVTSRFNKTVEEMMRLLDGTRVVRVNVADYFSGGIETEEQLDAALSGLREECERYIGAGKKVLI